jgi:hypothetical protein
MQPLLLIPWYHHENNYDEFKTLWLLDSRDCLAKLDIAGKNTTIPAFRSMIPQATIEDYYLAV